MSIDRWPIAARAQLLRAFRPGEPADKEAPFRTLRAHGWASSGVSIVARSEARAAGRVSVFSALNVDAARSAREGDEKAAAGFAKVAAQVESSPTFARLRELLSGRALTEITSVVDGEVAVAESAELLQTLRELASKTRTLRTRVRAGSSHVTVIAGRISDVGRDFLVLRSEDGGETLVPRWLAHSARREKVGECLVLVTDRIDERQMVVNAVAAIELTGPAEFTPFGRTAPVRTLTQRDARLLARDPKALSILVPVTIGR